MIHNEERCIAKRTVTTRINCDVCGCVIWERTEDSAEHPDIDPYQLRKYEGDSIDVCDSCAGRLIQMARSGLLATALKELGE